MGSTNYFFRLVLAILCFSPIWAAEQKLVSEKEKFEILTGFQGTFNEQEKVFKAVFPRIDNKISVDQTMLDPFMGLTSWAAFTQIEDRSFMVMGDFVLFQDEVNPVMSGFLNNGIHVTALHNHFFFDTPKVYFMHIEGEGALNTLAAAVKMALETVKEIREKKSSLPTSFGNAPISNDSSISLAPLEGVFRIKGQSKAGMAKFIFGRTVKMGGITVGAEMGVNTWAAFAGSDENALVDGDFAVLEGELQPVLQTLRSGKINIVAIHNHMILEQPRMLFLHYWGTGRAEDLAKTIKQALEKLTQPIAKGE